MKPQTANKSDNASDCNNCNPAILQIHNAVCVINEAIQRGVNTGLSVELVRISRCHDGTGHWGDQMQPIIRKQGQKTDRRNECS